MESTRASNSDQLPRQLLANVVPVQEVVILLHGIRTFANWQPLVKRVLEEIPGVHVVPIKFGFLDAIRFWCPVGTRQIPINEVRREIQIARAAHPDARISVIAHSFGTYAISQILVENPDFKLHRLVLAGSIVERTFRWDFIRDRLATDVVNDYGTRDIWPVLANSLSWGYGDTGRHGFGRGAHVIDRAHNYTHSEFFNEAFVRKYWKPWFSSCEYVKSGWEESMPPAAYWHGVMSFLPIKSILATFAILLIVFFFRGSILPANEQQSVVRSVDHKPAERDASKDRPAGRLLPNLTDPLIAARVAKLENYLPNWDDLETIDEKSRLMAFTEQFIGGSSFTFASVDPFEPTIGIHYDLELRKAASSSQMILRDIRVKVVAFHSLAPAFVYGASMHTKPTILIELENRKAAFPWEFSASWISPGDKAPFESFKSKQISIDEFRWDAFDLKISAKDRGLYSFEVCAVIQEDDKSPQELTLTTQPLVVPFFSSVEMDHADYKLLRDWHDKQGGIFRQMK